MRFCTIAILILMTTSVVAAAGTMMPDSFGFLPGTSILPRGKLALEGCFTWVSNDQVALTGFPNALFRYGLKNDAEFQFLLPSLNWLSGSSNNDNAELSNPMIRFKGRVSDQSGAIPDVVARVDAGIPIWENPIASDNMWSELTVHLKWHSERGLDLVPVAGLYLHDPAGILETYGVLARVKLSDHIWLAGDYYGITDEGDDSQEVMSGQVFVQTEERVMIGVGMRRLAGSGADNQFLLGFTHVFGGSSENSGDEDTSPLLHGSRRVRF